MSGESTLAVLNRAYRSAVEQLNTRIYEKITINYDIPSMMMTFCRDFYRAIMWGIVVSSFHILTHSIVINGLWIKYFSCIPLFVWKNWVRKVNSRKRHQTQTSGSRKLCAWFLRARVLINMIVNVRKCLLILLLIWRPILDFFCEVLNFFSIKLNTIL